MPEEHIVPGLCRLHPQALLRRYLGDEDTEVKMLHTIFISMHPFIQSSWGVIGMGLKAYTLYEACMNFT